MAFNGNTLTTTGTLIIDSDTDITLDAAGGAIAFRDAGTDQLTLDMDGTAGAQVIQLRVDADDLIFKQFDGTVVLTLDDDTTVKVATDLTVGDDVGLISDGAVLTFGANSEVTLTHVHDDGLLLNADMQLQFRDSAINIRSDADGDLDINADDEIELNSTLIDINGNVEISGTLAQVGVATFTARDIHSGGITIANDGQIGSVGDADSIAISSAGVVTMTQIPVLSAGLNVSGGTIAGTIATATQNSITTATGLVSVGALDSGSITSGFGTIDTGASTITTTGLISGGSLDIDDVLINGTTIGHTDDTDLITLADGIATVAGEVSMTTLDIGGTNVTSTAVELNYVDGVTSNVQTQLDTKTSTGKAVALALIFG